MAGNTGVQFRRVDMIVVESGMEWNIQQRTVDIEEAAVKGVNIG